MSRRNTGSICPCNPLGIRPRLSIIGLLSSRSSAPPTFAFLLSPLSIQRLKSIPWPFCEYHTGVASRGCIRREFYPDKYSRGLAFLPTILHTTWQFTLSHHVRHYIAVARRAAAAHVKPVRLSAGSARSIAISLPSPPSHLAATSADAAAAAAAAAAFIERFQQACGLAGRESDGRRLSDRPPDDVHNTRIYRIVCVWRRRVCVPAGSSAGARPALTG